MVSMLRGLERPGARTKPARELAQRLRKGSVGAESVAPHASTPGRSHAHSLTPEQEDLRRELREYFAKQTPERGRPQGAEATRRTARTIARTSDSWGVTGGWASAAKSTGVRATR